MEQAEFKTKQYFSNSSYDDEDLDELEQDELEEQEAEEEEEDYEYNNKKMDYTNECVPEEENELSSCNLDLYFKKKVIL